MSSEYSFGDDARAADRLELLAALFAPTTSAFLHARAPVAPVLAVDLGCGPGHTTELLGRETRPRRLVAVENSAEFATQARARLGRDCEVLQADARELPDRVRDAELIFARMVLTHLADPLRAIAHWRERLAPGGVLLLEEVESIATEDPVFADYLDRQRAMLAARGQMLDIGPRLDDEFAGTSSSAVAMLTPEPATVARMFALNYESWRGPDGEAIADGLRARADGSTMPAAITWRMRQIAIPAGS